MFSLVFLIIPPKRTVQTLNIVRQGTLLINLCHLLAPGLGLDRAGQVTQGTQVEVT